ncbi:MAG: double-strand break repair protein AddB, partial [Acetobacteraceae bacterium]|nr:double-strand break repair protein AddB [Acetobacteraceae bacterium]
MNLFAIPPHAPFLDALAAAWLAEQDRAEESLAQGLILLPTRRAARALVEAFLRASEGRALLLPRITAIGALDETPLALSGALELPPAVAPARRLAELARLILALKGEFGSPESADGAWALARALAVMMDEAEREEIDLAARLPQAVDGDYADHWQVTLQFLRIVTEAWPKWLKDQRLMNPAARQMALLRAAARAWRAAPPSYPIWAAGIISGLPAIAELLRTIAELPRGRVILPGFDPTLADALTLPETHPEALVRRMFALLGAKPDAVRPWPHPLPPSVAPKERAGMLWRALRPAEALAEWQDRAPLSLQGLSLLKPQDEQEEAVAIALILRDALEQPGARAALVTPDRALAVRVSAELLRFGILADDSAGEALAETPPAVFLRLLAEAVAAELAPVPLLGLLKHPFTAAGLAPADARAAARRLELACLRGRAPEPGLRGLRYAIQFAPEVERRRCEAFLARLETALAPLLRVFASPTVAPYQMLVALIEAGEALAATDAEPGATRLWAAEEGAALAAHLSELLAALPRLPDQSPAVLPGLLRAMLEGAVVRTRRALRGRQGTEHPRVFIWGLLEAQLQSADVMVLG